MGPAGNGATQDPHQGQPVHVPLEGDLDHETAPEMRARMLRLLEDGKRDLVLDLARCTYIDSSGMLMLVAIGERAAALGGAVALCNASATLVKMLRLGRMGQALGIREGGSLTAAAHLRFPDTGLGRWDVARFVAPARPQFCAEVRHAVMREAAATPLTDEDRADMELAVGEAFANAVRHGTRPGGEGHVTIRVLTGEDAFVVQISDQGEGFDPSLLPRPRPQEIREGGLGIFYMQALMDAVEFEASPQGTTVRLLKRYP